MCPEMTISSSSFVKKFKILNLKRLLAQSIKKKEQEDETKLQTQLIDIPALDTRVAF